MVLALRTVPILQESPSSSIGAHCTVKHYVTVVRWETLCKIFGLGKLIALKIRISVMNTLGCALFSTILWFKVEFQWDNGVTRVKIRVIVGNMGVSKG